MTGGERTDLLEEEWLLVRHSGEIPEVALHASLYYLSDDNKGPRLTLAPEEIRLLEEAALTRYREIILRDLDVSNRDLPLFRGVRRANHNWYRFARFSDKLGSASDGFRLLAAEALLDYLRVELEELAAGTRASSINCTAEALLTFAIALGIEEVRLPENWVRLCEQGS